MRLFVLGNSYSVRCIIYDIEYLIGKSISDIYLLNEYHSEKEFIHKRTNANIVVSNNVCDCVKNSDWVIVIQDDNVSVEKIDYIKRLSDVYNTRYILIDNPWYVNESKNENLSIKFGVPTILVLSIGEYTQSYCLELKLNKYFACNTIVNQIFSKQTKAFIDSLRKHQIINSILCNSLNTNSELSELNIASMSIKNCSQLLQEPGIKESFETLSPDCIVINTNYRMEDLNDFIISLKYTYDIPVCAIVVSDYIPLYNCSSDVVPLLNIDRITTESIYSDFIYLIDQIYESDNIIKDNILPHIYLPDGISVVK